VSGSQRFRAGTEFMTLEVTSEPYLAQTFKGYIAAVEVLEVATGVRLEFLIGGVKSLAEQLEPLRAANGGGFKGLRFKVKKASSDPFSPYVVHSDDGGLSSGERKTPEDKLWDRITDTYRR